MFEVMYLFITRRMFERIFEAATAEATKSNPKNGQQQHPVKNKSKVDTALSLLRELRAETSFGMLRLLKPGQRTIVVLVDKDTREELTQEFAECVWPWRHNKTLMFGFVMVDKNTSWFRQLLSHTIPAEEGTQEAVAAQKMLRKINPRQVVGTVLSLNGWRLYFCMYHPKHAPSMVGFRPPKKAQTGGITGKFLGLDDDERNLFIHKLN